MPPVADGELFLLGLAVGVALWTVAAYRHISPRWLQGLLVACNLWLIGRYALLGGAIGAEPSTRPWLVRTVWLASPFGFMLPSAVAVDQLIRHPAMSARKLLIAVSPFVAAGVGVALFNIEPSPRGAGWLPIGAAWRWALTILQSVFAILTIGLCSLLARKIPVRPIQWTLVSLAAAQTLLALDGLRFASGRWTLTPFLYSDLLAWTALWHAFDLGERLQRGM